MPYFKKNGNLCLGWGIDENNLHVCSQPFIAKAHVEILGYLYPPDIKNWYCDNWIQNTYEKMGKLIKTESGVMKNLISASEKNRYDISVINEEKLNQLVSNSINKLQDYIPKNIDSL